LGELERWAKILVCRALNGSRRILCFTLGKGDSGRFLAESEHHTDASPPTYFGFQMTARVEMRKYTGR